MGLEENLREIQALRRVLESGGQGGAFGREVRLARTKRGMTLEALSAATGMAKSYLSQIETGYAPPPRDDKIRRIAAALGMNEEGLVAQAHLSELPASAKERIAALARLTRLREMLDGTEEVIGDLLAKDRAARDVPLGHGMCPDVPKPDPSGTGQAPPLEKPFSPDMAKAKKMPRAGRPPHAPAPETPAPGAEAPPTGVDLDRLYKSGLLHHLLEWGEKRVEEGRVPLRTIPIINKVSAGYPQDFTDLGYPVGVADEYIAAPADLADPSAFAVRVVGDSMEPKYREGDVVIFSPAAPVDSGDDCFVRFAVTGGPSDGESTFKRVFHDGPDRVRLQPLNERYAPTVVTSSEIQGIFRAVARYETL